MNTDFILQDLPKQEYGRCGIIPVVGRANVGKSTLLNRIAEEKVSIVSAVPQTTRNIVRVVVSEDRGQLVFLDTPGVHKAMRELNHLMNRMARNTLAGSDLILLVLDASLPPREEDEGWMRRICREPARPVFVLNKTDLPASHESAYRELWQSVAEEKQSEQVPVWYRAAAGTGTGVQELIDGLFGMMPESPFLFSREVLTDFPRKLAIADLVREKLFRELHDEIPHSLAVEVHTLAEKENGWEVALDIIVKRSGQKGIVIGRKGRLLKKIKHQAERELEEIYEVPVSLIVWVKVDPKWDRNHWILKRLGYKE